MYVYATRRYFFFFLERRRWKCSLAVSGVKACVDVCDFGSFSFVARLVWLWRCCLKTATVCFYSFLFIVGCSERCTVIITACPLLPTDIHTSSGWLSTFFFYIIKRTLRSCLFIYCFLTSFDRGNGSCWVTFSKPAFVLFFPHHLCSRETASCIYLFLAVMYYSGCEY